MWRVIAKRIINCIKLPDKKRLCNATCDFRVIICNTEGRKKERQRILKTTSEETLGPKTRKVERYQLAANAIW